MNIKHEFNYLDEKTWPKSGNNYLFEIDGSWRDYRFSVIEYKETTENEITKEISIKIKNKFKLTDYRGMEADWSRCYRHYTTSWAEIPQRVMS